MNKLWALMVIPVVMIIGMQVAESQVPATAPVSNVIKTPGTVVDNPIKIGTQGFNIPTANHASQSPFMQVSPGVKDITISPPEGYSLVEAGCVYQESNGSFVDTGVWNGGNVIVGVELVVSRAHICTWLFEQDDSLEEDINNISAKIETKVQQREQIQNDITVREARINQLTAEKQSLTGDLNAIQKEIDDAKTEIERLRALLADL